MVAGNECKNKHDTNENDLSFVIGPHIRNAAALPFNRVVARRHYKKDIDRTPVLNSSAEYSSQEHEVLHYNCRNKSDVVGINNTSDHTADAYTRFPAMAAFFFSSISAALAV